MFHASLSRLATSYFPGREYCHVQEGSERKGQRVRGGAPLPKHLHGAIVALGNFDGFHLGHQAVARRARELADERGVAAIVATFDPHPVRRFRPDDAPFRLSSLPQRQRAICMSGIDAMMVFEFDERLADASPATFVNHWLRDIGGVVTGSSFFFGKARSGDVSTLRRLGRQRNLICSTLDSVVHDGETVSSTRIRRALARGDCPAAAKLLTRNFAVEGRLDPGLGFDSDFPLMGARLGLGEYLDVRRGAYAVRARLPSGRYLNGLGFVRDPSTSTPRIIELFIAGLSDNNIGYSVEIEFLSYLHDAKELDDPSALRQRVENQWL